MTQRSTLSGNGHLAVGLIVLAAWCGGSGVQAAQPPGAASRSSGTENRDAGPFRTWTDITGAEVKAELIEVVLDTVVLRAPDGETARIPIHRLHPDDQAYARQQSSAPGRIRAGQAVIRVDAQPRQQMIYGMDFERLWHLGALREPDKLAELAVADCRVDYVRIGIDGRVEIEEGDRDWFVYDRKQFPVMRALQRANPDIKFFASPRPFHEAVADAPFTPFPLWITEFQRGDDRRHVKFHPEKAAEYMVRQIQYLRSEGFNIVYMDAKNECCIFLRPGEIGEMIDRMRREMGDDMPIVIAPSSHNRAVGQAWLEEAIRIGRTDFFDIIATHNTDQQAGTFEDFMRVAQRIGKPVWNTEMHGYDGPDDKAVANSIHLWEHARAGFSGMNQWLSLGNEPKDHKMFRNVNRELVVMRTYYIFRQLVNTSGGGHYLRSTIPGSLTSTAAFIKDNTVTVWVLNDSNQAVDNVAIDLDGKRLENPIVEIMWWGPDNQREGSTERARTHPLAPFTHDIRANALYCFTFTVR